MYTDLCGGNEVKYQYTVYFNENPLERFMRYEAGPVVSSLIKSEEHTSELQSH